MTHDVKFELIRANAENAEEMKKLQTEAFEDLLEKYHDYDTSPATRDLEYYLVRLKDENSYFYFITVDGEKVGGIRVADAKDGSSKRISPIFILKAYRGKGYGQKAIIEAERIHGAENWNLDTIITEEGNCYLYEKMGYKRTGETKKVNDLLTLVYYSK